MPVNYTQIQQQIREKSSAARARQVETQRRLDLARQLLTQHAGQMAELRDLVQRASAQDRNLRCAVPLDEPLDGHFNAPVPPEYPILLAADGSQINPNRHAALEFAVINLGIVTLFPGKAETPIETVSTDLLVFDDMESEQGPITEEVVALRRDLKERRELAGLAARLPGTLPPITLTDGPLELYREPSQNQAFQKAMDEYLDVLVKMASINTITAGYVDKPGSDLVVRLLELALAGASEDGSPGKDRPLRGVPDRVLFAALPPGERTAVFAIQSNTASHFRNRDEQLAPCFFYLNVGRVEKPWLVRVEIPLWVASRPRWVDLLHASLLQQCRQMGSQPYPYGLHRAHEVALVTFQDAQQVQSMIELELLRLGIAVGEKSNKQVAKDAAKRTRYGQ